MDRRKEELEKKRQKLAELRRAREERRALLESQSTQTNSVKIIKQRFFFLYLTSFFLFSRVLQLLLLEEIERL